MAKLLRLAFDLDETLGVPLIDGAQFAGWQHRTGSLDLLGRLRTRCQLVLWSVSNRVYVDKALACGLGEYFRETYSWDELPCTWKDVRRIHADLLVDDSPHHRDEAAKHGLEGRYIVVPVYGSPEDVADPLAWVRLVEASVLPRG